MSSISGSWLRFALAAGILFGAGCGSGGESTSGSPSNPQAVAPTITTAAALNGAVVVSLSSSTSGATIYYTVDGSTPTSSSQIYEAPFLVASNLTVKAMAAAPGDSNSGVASQNFAPNIPSGALVWSDEFSTQPAPTRSPIPPCGPTTPATGRLGQRRAGRLLRVELLGLAVQPLLPTSMWAPTVICTSWPSSLRPASTPRRESRPRDFFSFQYGRIEFRAQVPEAQGFWPAAWLLGNNITTANWPACGEMDVLERIDERSWHTRLERGLDPRHRLYRRQLRHCVFDFPDGQTAAGWHTYGMIWSKGSVAYYVDDPTQPYVTYTPSSIAGLGVRGQSPDRFPAQTQGNNFVVQVSANGEVGQVYLFGGGSHAVCLDGESGHLIWSEKVPGLSRQGSPGAGPVIAGSTLVYMGGGGFFKAYGLNLQTGKMKWVLEKRSPALASGSNDVFLATQGGLGAIAVDAETGKVKWAHRTVEVGGTLTKIVYSEGRLYSDSAQVLDARDGHPIIKLAVDPDVILANGGKVYMTGDSIPLMAVNAQTGKTLWSAPNPLRPSPKTRHDVYLAASRRYVVATFYDTLAFQAQHGVLRVYESVSGRLLWEKQLASDSGSARGASPDS
jgi:outer membrane protein assembly factor BamB